MRQQSKEIAENVRNKVRKEKEKQCCTFDRENEKKLRDWQARKLLALHNQYQESLQDIGLGHKEAEIFDLIEEDIETEKECRAKIAAERGRLARQNLKCASAQQGKFRREVKSADTPHRSTCGDKGWPKCNQKKHFYTVVGATDPADRYSPIQVSLKTSNGSHSTISSGHYDSYRPYAAATGDKSRPISPQSEKDTASTRRKINSEASEEGFSSGSPKKFISQLADISEASDGSSPRRFPPDLESDRDVADDSEVFEGDNISGGLRKFGSQLVRDQKGTQSRRGTSEAAQQRRLSLEEKNDAPAGSRKTSSKLQVISDRRSKEFGSQMDANGETATDVQRRELGPQITDEPEGFVQSRPKITTSRLQNRERNVEGTGRLRKSSSVLQKDRRREFDSQINEESDGFTENRPKTTARGTQNHERNVEVTSDGRIRKSSSLLRKDQDDRRRESVSKMNEKSEGFSENRSKTIAFGAQENVTSNARIRKSSSILQKDQDVRRRESGSQMNESSASRVERYERDIEAGGRKKTSSSAALRRREFGSQMEMVERREYSSQMNESAGFTESRSKTQSQGDENDMEGAREIAETVEGSRPKRPESAVVADFEKAGDSTEEFTEDRPRKASASRDEDVITIDQRKTSNTVQYPIETRISDRIKHRSTLSTAAPDLCDTLPEELSQQTYRPVIRSNPDLTRPVSSRHVDAQVKPTVAQKEISASLEIPEKAEVIGLKEKKKTADGTSTTTSCNRLTCSDYQRHAKGYVQARANVERIDEEQVQVVDYEAEDDCMKKMERQDREAAERGKQAWQKEKTKRDYEDLMKKLPVLQKQENLNRISNSRPDYHMSEDRLREEEGKRQFQMENAFENAFPNLKPNLITTQGISQEDVENEPFRVISVGKKNRGISVGTWDVSMKGNAKEDVECECCSPENQTKRERQLRELLLNLQAQKEMLLKEVDGLPKDSKLNELLGSLHDISTKRKTSKSKKASIAKEKKRSLEEISLSSSSSSSTPRKTSKTKCKRCVLIRQNMSTQTSPVAKSDAQVGDTTISEKVERSTSPPQPPKVASKSTSPSQPHICPQTGQICDSDEDKCKSTDDKLCEIVIKIHENETQPEILVKPVAKPNKKIDLTADKVVITEKKPVRKKSVEVCAPMCTGDQSKKWREQLSQSSPSYTTSSTSYYSPPDVTLFEEETRKRSRLRDVLQEKPKQTNLASRCTTTSAPCSTTQTARKLHPFITKYIEKLLSMSRSSIEDLSVSSVSDVTTPTSSLMETSSNVPMDHLKKLLKRLGITHEEVRAMYGKSGKHESVLSSLPSSSSTSTSISNEILQHRVDSCCCETQDEYTNTCLSAKVSKSGVSEEEDEKYCEMMTKYAEITNSCNKRISNLTAMIEKVRSEKAQIMNTPDSSDPVDKDNTTTAYLDLPPGDTTSDNSAAEQERLDKMLLTIDESFAENLKRMTSGQIRERYEIADVEFSREDISEDSVADVRRRYRQLMTMNTETFEPVLKDIPKLPLLCECPNKRPPPSKGLTAAKKFNEDITGVPHELSTIMEGDSQISTKAPKSNDDLPENAEMSHRSTETSTPDILREITANFRQGTAATIPSEQGNTKKEVVFDQNIQVQPLSSSSGEDMESLEKMLREMGMGWAIVTLRKTQEALALASSSSSLDVNIQTQKGVQFTDSSGSTSEISLKGVMSRHLLTKISSTTSSTSETSISLLMKEFEDISAILGSGSTTKDGRRTSTPIQTVPTKSKTCTCNRSGSGSDGNKTNCAFHNNDFISR